MSNKIRQPKGDTVFDIINIAIMVVILALIIYPLWFVVIASVSDSQLVLSGDVWFYPKGVHFSAYQKVFKDPTIMTGYRNTLIYTFVGTVFNLVATVALAYPLSRKDFAGRNVIMIFLTITMFFNGGMIPTYLVYKQIHIINTFWVMVIPGLVSVYNTIIVRTFFQNLPYELQEAAMIDGCGNMRMLLQIVLPLSKPILAVMVIFYGVGHWNEYFSALLYISNKDLKPLALVLRDILVTATASVSDKQSGGSGESELEKAKTAEALKYAVIIVSTVPVLCLYPFMQKHFSKGVMLGAIKG